jgi:hypothetical protein
MCRLPPRNSKWGSSRIENLHANSSNSDHVELSTGAAQVLPPQLVGDAALDAKRLETPEIQDALSVVKEVWLEAETI